MERCQGKSLNNCCSDCATVILSLLPNSVHQPPSRAAQMCCEAGESWIVNGKHTNSAIESLLSFIWGKQHPLFSTQNQCLGKEIYQIEFVQHLLKATALRLLAWKVMRITCQSKSLAKLVLEETWQLRSNHLCRTIYSFVSDMYEILVWLLCKNETILCGT